MMLDDRDHRPEPTNAELARLLAAQRDERSGGNWLVLLGGVAAIAGMIGLGMIVAWGYGAAVPGLLQLAEGAR